MKVTLRIDNMDDREDGGPMEHVSEGRDFIVGRHSQSDWHLPDKTVSRSHFEIRFEPGGVALYDLSGAGTFVVGESHRVISPRLLRSGERLRVGPYILSVLLEDDREEGWGRMSLPRAVPPAPMATPPHRTSFGEGSDGSLAPRTAPPQGGAAIAPLAAPLPGHGFSAEADWRDELGQGMGLPPGALRALDPQLLGRILLGITEDLMGLLAARAIIKRNVRSKAQTMIAPLENNPLKFRASAGDALAEMLSRPSAGFLGPEAAYRNAFSDLRRHETAMIAALQPALAHLLEDLSPEAIEHRTEPGLFANRKARAWEVFVERWDAKTHPYENGMLDLFLTYFAESYDQAAGQQTTPPLQPGGRGS